MTVNFHPVQATKTTWNNASKPKKAAMVAGAAVATAAVATTIAAGVKGKANPDAKGISKFTSRMKDGYTQIWNAVKSLPSKFHKASDAVETVADKTAETTENLAEKTAETVENAAEKVAEAVENVAAKAE